MTHGRKVCQHGTVISQCRCIKPHKTTEVVRPCPFGVQHLGMMIRHPEPPTAGPQEPPQAPEGEPMTPGPVPVDPPVAPGGAEGVDNRCPTCGSTDVRVDTFRGAEVARRITCLTCEAVTIEKPGQPGPRAFKQCVFRSCDWTTPEVDSLLELPAQNETFRAHLRTHRIEIELMAEAIR